MFQIRNFFCNKEACLGKDPGEKQVVVKAVA
jgi:hypothetical protein